MKYMRDTINNGIDDGGSGIINGTEGSVKGISACYKLTDDINLGENWIAICQYKIPGTDENSFSGTIENSFSGTIDGNNKTITYICVPMISKKRVQAIETEVLLNTLFEGSFSKFIFEYARNNGISKAERMEMLRIANDKMFM